MIVGASANGRVSIRQQQIRTFRLVQNRIFRTPIFRCCVWQGNAVNGTAENAIKALRDRAHNTQAFTLSESFLLDEWQREFYAEGRRRTDLVRFGQFAGETATLNWEGRGGANSGDAPKSIDKKFNIFPLPLADVTANDNLAGINEANGY